MVVYSGPATVLDFTLSPQNGEAEVDVTGRSTMVRNTLNPDVLNLFEETSTYIYICI